MLKAQPKLIFSIIFYFQYETQGFSLLIITSSIEYRKYQFLIHSILFFQPSQSWFITLYAVSIEGMVEYSIHKYLVTIFLILFFIYSYSEEMNN